MRQPRLRKRRGAFTLIELLVVIAIIAVLVGLTAAGIYKIMGKGPEMAARADINQLVVAIEAFKRDHGVEYVPSALVLYEDMSYPNRNVQGHIERESYLFLKRAFGNRLQAPIDWNGNNTLDGPHTLEGQQCLVFILGGIPSGSSPSDFACLGFSNDPRNPAVGTSRTAPVFDFKPNRLRREGPGGFFVYLDAYNNEIPQPYLYFSSRKSGNDYTADCPTYFRNASGPLLPYRTPGGRFLNPNGFQIICAGADGVFADPTSTDPNAAIWDPANGNTEINTQDNQANFAPTVLGTGG